MFGVDLVLTGKQDTVVRYRLDASRPRPLVVLGEPVSPDTRLMTVNRILFGSEPSLPETCDVGDDRFRA